MIYVIRAHALGAPVRYLTGKSGDNWLSKDINDAFPYADDTFAKAACTALNSNDTDDRLQGLVFCTVPYEEPADPIHDLYTDADKDRPDVICDSNGQVALGLCKKCGKGECELVEPCTPRSKP